ncbi:uncharacterized protein LOC119520331 isoform X7 [Choloepus didactylus]|uniref:uncharacterized protein LOC119520331 isoform X7 n=1 Tax=Choloepus didactylus TaxID=27675 RepID=UPI0018A0E54A|nr:uncharacterized protein LOC119520331 isoform X7 [Choloepus didactylus]
MEGTPSHSPGARGDRRTASEPPPKPGQQTRPRDGRKEGKVQTDRRPSRARPPGKGDGGLQRKGVPAAPLATERRLDGIHELNRRAAQERRARRHPQTLPLSLGTDPLCSQ